MLSHIHSYNEDYRSICKNTIKKVERTLDKMKLRQFYLTTHNFKNFLPQVFESKSHEEVYVDLLCQRELAPLDANKYAELIDDVQLKGEIEAILQKEEGPYIFCVNHLGSYRAIMGLLAKLDYDFSLVVDKQVFTQQKESIHEIVEKVNKKFDVKSDFDLINAEDFDAAMLMLKKLRKGKSLVLYVDGNTGTGGVFRHDEKLQNIEFLGQQIFARQGIAYLSFLSNIPIIPVTSYRENMDAEQISINDVVLEFYPPISPANVKSKKEYCFNTTQKLYKLLEDKVKEYPLQWEGWLYVHKYLDETKLLDKVNPTSTLKPGKYRSKNLFLNESRFGIFTFHEQYFLFDGIEYRTYEIDEQTFEQLQIFWKRNRNVWEEEPSASREVIEELINRQVLYAKEVPTPLAYQMDAYLNEYAHVKEAMKKAAIKATSEWQLKQFYLVTAGFRKVLPESFHVDDYQKKFVELMYGRRLATMDEKYFERVCHYDLRGNVDALQKNKEPQLFCAYHMGSYRAIIGTLARFGHDFTLVVNKKVYDNGKESIAESVRRVNNLCGTHSEFEILVAEEFDTAMKMVRHLQQGKSIIAYVDGNTGTGGAFRKDKQLQKVDFLNTSIYARQGVAYVSYLANVPIVPVLSFREKETDIVLDFLPEISPQAVRSRRLYCTQTIKQLYGYLADRLRQYPLQWEGWLYVHKYLETESFVSDEENKYFSEDIEREDILEFNHERYGIFKVVSDCYLFDRDTYDTYPISNIEFSLLELLWKKERTVEELLKKTTLQNLNVLLGRQVLSISKSCLKQHALA